MLDSLWAKSLLIGELTPNFHTTAGPSPPDWVQFLNPSNVFTISHPLRPQIARLGHSHGCRFSSHPDYTLELLLAFEFAVTGCHIAIPIVAATSLQCKYKFSATSSASSYAAQAAQTMIHVNWFTCTNLTSGCSVPLARPSPQCCWNFSQLTLPLPSCYVNIVHVVHRTIANPSVLPSSNF